MTLRRSHLAVKCSNLHRRYLLLCPSVVSVAHYSGGTRVYPRNLLWAACFEILDIFTLPFELSAVWTDTLILLVLWLHALRDLTSPDVFTERTFCVHVTYLHTFKVNCNASMSVICVRRYEEIVSYRREKWVKLNSPVPSHDSHSALCSQTFLTLLLLLLLIFLLLAPGLWNCWALENP